ncbi:MAG: hydrolase [Polyangiaceae bacterium]|nr:hydrolase [Polyangiaceae bacterium]
MGLLLVGCSSDPAAPADGSGGGAAGSGEGGAGEDAAGGASDPEGDGAAAGGFTGGAGQGGGDGGLPGGLVSCAGKDGPTGELELMVSVGGEELRVLLHVPESHDGSAALPLVLGLHGFTASPEDIRDSSHLDRVGDERGFISAFPEGKSGSWNGGVCCGVSEWNEEQDVAFIAATLDAISAQYCVDDRRVHATGFSNGGFLTHRLACELSDRVASIGVVAGQEGVETCTPSRPVPVLHIHGTADPVVPFGGNPVLSYPSTEATIAGWVERNGCSDATTTTLTAGDTTCEAHTSCTQGAVVELCRVEGGMHDWFGGGSAWTEDGPPEGFVATMRIVDFLEAHPMP